MRNVTSYIRYLGFAMVLVGAVAAPGVARAHDLWVEPDGPHFVVRYGHRGGAVLPLAAAKVKAIRCARPGAAPIDLLTAAVFSPTEARVTAKCAAVSVLLDNGFWSLTPDGEKNLPKSKCPDAVKAWESRQLAKWVDPQALEASKPVGDELEIVAVSDLRKVKTGDKATFRVLLSGKPVSGALAAMEHKTLGETDSAGEVRLRIRSTQVESLSVSLRRPLSSPDADSQVLEASLTFPVAR